MARVLIVGGGCRGRRLAGSLTADGHAVRVTTRSRAGRSAIEACGGECWIGDPQRLATLRGALEGVSLLCWLLGSAQGSAARLRALHTHRLSFFLTQAIDTTVRGVVVEVAGTPARAELLREGELLARGVLERNSIPFRLLDVAPAEAEAWLVQARAAVAELLSSARYPAARNLPKSDQV